MHSSRRTQNEIDEINKYERMLPNFLHGIAHTSSQVDELKRLTKWGYMTFFAQYMEVSEYIAYESAISAKETLLNYYVANGYTVLADELKELEIPLDTRTKRDILEEWKAHLGSQLEGKFSKTQIKQILRLSKKFITGKTNPSH